jgi:putative endonuclease
MGVLARIFARRVPGSLGEQGEQAAARFLKRQGYKIIDRGCRSKVGEIDLVALDGETIVLVEVKTRRTDERGAPAEAVGPVKQRRLTRAALAYLKARGLLEQRARFDVVAVVWPSGASEPTIQHLKNAFEPAEAGQFFS